MRPGIQVKDPLCSVIVIDRLGHIIDVAQYMTMRHALRVYPPSLVEVWDNGTLIWNGPRYALEGDL